MTTENSKARLTVSQIMLAIQAIIIVGLAWSLHVDNQARLADNLLLSETALSLRQTSYYLNDVCTTRHESLVN